MIAEMEWVALLVQSRFGEAEVNAGKLEPRICGRLKHIKREAKATAGTVQ